ncbi:AI-2E family transporter [Candidatus Falkowbacteria bacterium]|nr:AI-2E family transporter [Candidatus Falkowbacteria bacterium]
MELNKRPISINITSKTIIKIIAIFVLLYFLYLISDILILFFVSLVFSSALDPWVDKLKKKKIPRSASVLLLYFTFFAVLGASLYLIIPPIISEINGIADNLPGYFEAASSKFSLLKDYSLKYGLLDSTKSSFDFITGYLQNTASGVFFTLFNIFGGIFSFVLILVLTFYMVVEESAIKKLVWSLAPEKHQTYVMHLINRIQLKMGYWLRGQLILALSLAIMSYIGLEILGINYALVSALFVGLFSFIPYMGAILGSLPAVLIAFTQSPLLAALAIALFYIIHLIEGNFLQPKIMQKAVGLNPIVSILAILAGFKLAGLIGAILSIPVTTALSVFIKDVFDSNREKREVAEEA